MKKAKQPAKDRKNELSQNTRDKDCTKKNKGDRRKRRSHLESHLAACKGRSWRGTPRLKGTQIPVKGT